MELKNPSFMAGLVYRLTKKRQEDEYEFIKNQKIVDLKNLEEQRTSTLNQLKEETQQIGKVQEINLRTLQEQNEREKSNLKALSSVSNIGGKTLNRLEIAQEIQKQSEEGNLQTNFEGQLEEQLKKSLNIGIQAESQAKQIENQFNQQVKSTQVQDLERQLNSIQSFVNMSNLQKNISDETFSLDVK